MSYISSAGVQWNPPDSGELQCICWSPVDLFNGKVQSESRESSRTWHIPADSTGLDMQIWPLSHWKTLGDKSCEFQQILVESNRIRQIVWGSVLSSVKPTLRPYHHINLCSVNTYLSGIFSTTQDLLPHCQESTEFSTRASYPSRLYEDEG